MIGMLVIHGEINTVFAFSLSLGWITAKFATELYRDFTIRFQTNDIGQCCAKTQAPMQHHHGHKRQ